MLIGGYSTVRLLNWRIISVDITQQQTFNIVFKLLLLMNYIDLSAALIAVIAGLLNLKFLLNPIEYCALQSYPQNSLLTLTVFNILFGGQAILY